ncbi:MAG: T9SS type A sorting domain-containing protein [Chitinophagales bacterium]|nr:T9SS type A sorting domain-containing protein [Chitinophagales bacterium]
MRNTILHIVLIFTCFILSGRAMANNAAAGVITYSWLSDSTYRVVFKLYNDCKGNPAPDTVSLCVYNSCTNSGFSTVMHKVAGNIRGNTVPNGSEVPVGCTPKEATRCTSVSSVLPGIREWWYADTVTLPARCNSWKFRVALNARNTAANIQAGNMLVETSFNNLLSLQNSSPDYSMPPAVFVCLNMPYTLDLNFTDADNDSLTYVVIPTQKATNLNCGTTPTNIGVKNINPPVDTVNNPIQTNQSFILDTVTGQMKFTTTSTYEQTFTLRVNEYRNGQLIGSVNTDIQVYAFKCGGIVPLLDNSKYNATDTVIGGDLFMPYGGGFYACVGTQVDYYFSIQASDSTAQLILTDSIKSIFPNAAVTYYKQGTDSVGVHIGLLPGPGDAGHHLTTLTITDTACRPPIGRLEYARVMDIIILDGVFAGLDTAVCAHEPVKLQPHGYSFPFGTFTWQMLPGSTGSLSCNNCRVAYGWPAPTATYVLTASSGWCASTYTDTINVSHLSTPVTYPKVQITVSPSSNIWQWLQATFTALVTDCSNPTFQWMKNGKDIPGATSQSYSSTNLIDNDIISCRFGCNDSCPNPRDTVSNAIRMNVAMSVNGVSENETGMMVYPNPATGMVTVYVQHAGTKRTSLLLTDITGKLIMTKEISTDSIQLDISGLTKGMYLLTYKGDVFSRTVKLVKE